jgi:cyclopropane-fatty-acyl-phospholipid synthase
VPVATLVADVLGDDLPVRVECWDGSALGPVGAPATLVLRSPAALRRIVTCPGELGLARAYVAGDIDVEGDIYAVLGLRDRLPDVRLRPAHLVAAARVLGVRGLKPLRPPPEEARLRGRRHSKARDAAAVSHHYDVGNRFYERVLGPSLTYSCAVFETDDATLEEAQAAKHELICRKLGLQRGDRLLDVGCGWGSMAMHAARHHGAQVIGVTISSRQVEAAKQRVADEGLGDLVDIRLQDYRDVDDGPFDAICSIGMFEHVGRSRTAEYFGRLHELLRPQGRLLNHAISRPPSDHTAIAPRSFIGRYVFPDGELLDVGTTVQALEEVGFEARHVEELREHYARTLRHWVANLEREWDAAVDDVGVTRARVWRLYMAGSAINFEADRNRIHQVLAVKPAPGGDAAMPARLTWEREPLGSPTLAR